MPAGVREKQKTLETRQRKKKAEGTDKVEAAPGMTAASLRRFRAALVESTQGLLKRRRLRQ